MMMTIIIKSIGILIIIISIIIIGGIIIIFSGQIGDWKNWFTVAQSEMFDAWWDKETKGLDMFKFRYV